MMQNWPAPERNKEPILQVLRAVLPQTGRVLEIASGSGQHVVHFARAMPGITWLPSDPATEHLASITAHVEAARVGNVAAPLALDVLDQPWPVDGVDAVLCINMIHIAPWAACLALLAGCARVLPAGGVLYLYGPFLREGRHTAPSNEAFDEDLRRRNPQWGVRDLGEVERSAQAHGFVLRDVVQMPANNLSVVFSR